MHISVRIIVPLFVLCPFESNPRLAVSTWPSSTTPQTQHSPPCSYLYATLSLDDNLLCFEYNPWVDPSSVPRVFRVSSNLHLLDICAC